MKTSWIGYLSCRPHVCDGQLRARGTRIAVTAILDSIAEGATVDQVLGSYPSLTRSHVRAAVAYAAQLVREEPLTLLSRAAAHPS